jgi:hypothetical protein
MKGKEERSAGAGPSEVSLGEDSPRLPTGKGRAGISWARGLRRNIAEDPVNKLLGKGQAKELGGVCIKATAKGGNAVRAGYIVPSKIISIPHSSFVWLQTAFTVVSRNIRCEKIRKKWKSQQLS